MKKFFITFAILSSSLYSWAGPKVDIMFIIRQVKTYHWTYAECQGNPADYNPYKSGCLLNQQNVGSYIDREKIRTVPYSIFSPPNPNISNHNFWLEFKGGNVYDCIDDYSPGSYAQDPSNGSIFPCWVLKYYDLNVEGPNFINVKLKSQCESCTVNPGLGYGMVAEEVRTFAAFEIDYYQRCNAPCHNNIRNYFNLDLNNIFACNAFAVYGCQATESK